MNKDMIILPRSSCVKSLKNRDKNLLNLYNVQKQGVLTIEFRYRPSLELMSGENFYVLAKACLEKKLDAVTKEVELPAEYYKDDKVFELSFDKMIEAREWKTGAWLEVEFLRICVSELLDCINFPYVIFKNNGRIIRHKENEFIPTAFTAKNVLKLYKYLDKMATESLTKNVIPYALSIECKPGDILFFVNYRKVRSPWITDENTARTMKYGCKYDSPYVRKICSSYISNIDIGDITPFYYCQLSSKAQGRVALNFSYLATNCGKEKYEMSFDYGEAGVQVGKDGIRKLTSMCTDTLFSASTQLPSGNWIYGVLHI